MAANKYQMPRWILAAGGIVATAAIGELVGWAVRGSTFFVGDLFAWLQTRLSVTYSMQGISLLLIALGPVIFLIVLHLWHRHRSQKCRPKWEKYNTDRIEGVDWAWMYRGASIDGITPRCPECQRLLTQTGTTAFGPQNKIELRCGRCKTSFWITRSYATHEPFHEIRLEIDRRIASGEFIQILRRRASK